MSPLQARSPSNRKWLRAAIFQVILASIGCLSCHRAENPQTTYEHARTTFVHGNLAASQQEAERGYQRFRGCSPQWAWKFRTLEAEAMLWRGLYSDALR